MHAIALLKYLVAVLNDLHTGVIWLTSGILQLKEYYDDIYEYMRGFASHAVNPLAIPPNDLCNTLVQVKDDVQSNPWLALPKDYYKNIWNYSIMKVIPIVMNDFPIIMLTIALSNESLRMGLY